MDEMRSSAKDSPLVLHHPRIDHPVLPGLTHRFGAAIRPFPSLQIPILLLRHGDRFIGQHGMTSPTLTHNHGAGVYNHGVGAAPSLPPQVILTRTPIRTWSPILRLLPRPHLGAALPSMLLPQSATPLTHASLSLLGLFF